MIRSMTGFTRESRAFEWGVLTVEISSVNHRYQEISPRLPREMLSLEPLITARLRQGLGRGKIRCSAEIHWAPQFRTALLDATVLSNYHTQLASLAVQIGTATPSLASLLTLPGVFESPSALSTVEQEIGSALEELLEQAICSLMKMRTTEGGYLCRAMEEYLCSFETLLHSLETSWADKKDYVLEEMKARITGLLEGMLIVEIDQNRIAQEIVILADKWDISEEFVRSRSHLRQFKDVLNGGTSEGRKLDFLLQEMNREINTIGSKIADAELRWMVVEAKSLLEKIREQVQNVE